MFTFSIKRRIIRRFHFIVEQWTSKKCTKKLDAREATVVFMLKPIVFDVVVVVVKIFTFQILIFFFWTNLRGCYKYYKKKTSKLHKSLSKVKCAQSSWSLKLPSLNDWVHDLRALKLRRRIPSQFQLREYLRQVLPLTTILTREKWNWSVPSRDGLVLV